MDWHFIRKNCEQNTFSGILFEKDLELTVFFSADDREDKSDSVVNDYPYFTSVETFKTQLSTSESMSYYIKIRSSPIYSHCHLVKHMLFHNNAIMYRQIAREYEISVPVL